MLAGGTGNPYFTTDTAAALRAVEIEADALLKGTPGWTASIRPNPEKDKNAVKFDSLTFTEAYKNLKIMDLTAFTLCRENRLPVVVFNMNVTGNLIRLIRGEKVGTIVN